MRRRIQYFLWGCLLVLLWVSGGMVQAEAAQEQKQTVKIGYIDYDGFFEPDQDGLMTGYGMDYLEEISKYTGWKYEFVYDSWENHMQNLLNGEIDFFCHAQKTEEREKKYLFSKYSIGAEIGALYVKKDNRNYYYNDYTAFQGMRIAVLQDSFQTESFSDYAKEKGFSCTLMPYTTQEECFYALEQEKVEGVALGSLVPKSDYKLVCRFSAEPFYFMAGKQNAELVDTLDKALEEIKVNEPYFEAKLFQKYYGEDEAGTDAALTREDVAFIQNHPSVTVAFIPGRKPMSYVNEKGEICGIIVDIMEKIEKESGLKFHFVMMDKGVKAITYIQEHPDTLLTGVMTDNPDFHHGNMIVSDCFYTDEVVLVGKRGREYVLDGAQNTYRVAIPKSYAALENHITGNYPNFELVGADSTEDCIQMVLRGEADLLAQNINVVTPLLSKPRYESMTVLPVYFTEENTGMVLMETVENRHLMQILDKCLKTISKKDISQLIVDYTVTNGYDFSWKDFLYKFRYMLFVVFILGMMILLLLCRLWMIRRKHYLRLEIKNRQLADAVVQADNANYAKSRFLATMSHEIRTPLSAITGLVKLAQKDVTVPDRTKEYLKKIDTSSQILLRIINEVLDMSAIESNKLKIAKDPFELNEVLDSIWVVYQEQCEQKGIELILDKSEIPDTRLLGDEYRLRQILLNLISNALKFTPSGGKIEIMVQEVSVQQGIAYYHFEITDTGEGMSEEMQERLFKPFEQESAGTVQKHGGSGLGLSITKNLVELMRGTISCTSKKGEGTSFRLSIPFEMDEDVKGADAEEDMNYDFQGVRILLAEDTQITAEITGELLELVNIQTDHAWNGREAVEMFIHAEPGTYAAILLDIQMPEMNGFEAARAIRASVHEQAESIPIFAMSANAYTEDVSLSLHAGMNGHLAKPVDTDLLYRTLYKAIFQ